MGQGFRRATRALALIATAAAFAVPVAFAGDSADTVQDLATVPESGTGAMIDETPSAYFVELKGSAAAFRTEAKAAGLQYSERFAYGKLFNGVSIKLGSGQLNALQGLTSVKATFPVLRANFEPTSTPDLATAVVMTGADLANNSGFKGAGVKVAVMDTGIDYDHADLGGDGTTRSNSSVFPTARVIAGHDFVGDAFNADPNSPAFNPTPSPDAYPDDCNGHGSHVSGIVGASGAVKGVAPEVKFGAYRVFGCEGSTTADIMLAAMERALADGMHILNMSIGSAFMTWPQYPTAAGADALVDAGMVVVTSIGNSGADGLYSASAPGVGNNVIGTASYDNSHINALTFNTSGGVQMPYLTITTTDDPPTSGTTPGVVYVGRGCPGAALTPPGADDVYLANPAGKVALIDRGACTFASKYDRAVAAGAVDVVIANNVAGIFAGGGVIGQPGISAVGISLADGNTLKAEIAAGPTTLTWTATRVLAANPTGGQLSSFTSYGMNAELTLKPDIGAPGGLIRSTWPLEKGAYAILSGTSMASPHVAGAAALLRQARPTLAASEFRAILQNSADPRNSPLAALPDYVHRQGAGMVDVDDTILSTTTVTPGKISLGEGEGGTATLSIKNNSASAQTYTMSHAPALNTAPNANSPFSFGAQFAPSSVTFLPSSVTVPAGGTGTVVASVTANPGIAQQSQYGGYLRATTGGGQVFSVPYAGLKGDYQSIVVLHPTAFGFPWLAKLGGGFFTNQPAGATYTFAGGDIPYFLVHFRHQARNAVFTVLNAATGLPVDPEFSTIIRQDYLARNSTSGAFFAFSWDGKRAFLDNGKKAKEHRRAVPDGQYKVRLTVLKALGDPANPAHTETWTSPTITIDRP